MGQGKVLKLLALIHACQEKGVVWMANIIFAYVLDKIIEGGGPKRNQMAVFYSDHIEEGCLIVVRMEGYHKSFSAHLLSETLRSKVTRKWGNLPRSRPHEKIRAQEALPVMPDLSDVLKDLSLKQVEDLAYQGSSYFQSSAQGHCFIQALQQFALEINRRKEAATS